MSDLSLEGRAGFTGCDLHSGGPCAQGVMLWGHGIETSDNFIFESMFCK